MKPELVSEKRLKQIACLQFARRCMASSRKDTRIRPDTLRACVECARAALEELDIVRVHEVPGGYSLACVDEGDLRKGAVLVRVKKAK